MTDLEHYGPSGQILIKDGTPQLPNPWKGIYTRECLPSAQQILDEVNFIGKTLDESGEVYRAQNDPYFIKTSDAELAKKIPEFVDACLEEIHQYETVSRKPSNERLQELRRIAQNVWIIVDRSAPGDYFRAYKDDRHRDNPSTRAADRFRADQAAILAIVIAGIKNEWPEEELLLFLNTHVLTNDDPKLNALKEKARKAVQKSGIRLVYSGRPDEASAIERVLSKQNVFIPRDSVDILPPNEVDNTLDQTRQFKKYLQERMKDGEAFIEPTNIQGIRSSRMDQKQSMIPPGIQGYIYAMPTVVDDAAKDYRKKEVKGALKYALVGQATFEPSSHELI